MCKALDDWSRRERNEGRAEGRKEGFKKGVGIGINKGSTEKEKEMFEAMKAMGASKDFMDAIQEYIHSPSPKMTF